MIYNLKTIWFKNKHQGVMSIISVSQAEWNFAKINLTQAPNGTKIAHDELPETFSSRHSFINSPYAQHLAS